MRWRQLTVAERQLAVVWGGLVVVVVVLRPLWLFFAPHVGQCTFRSLTGIPCPTCGTTRAVVALLDLRVIEAASFNPLITAAATVFLVGGVLAPLWARWQGVVPAVPGRLPLWLRLGIVAAVALNWAWLIVASQRG